MKTHSIATLISAPTDSVFRFLEKPENVSVWATEFCQSMRTTGDEYIVRTKGGELILAITSHAESGVVDLWAGPSTDRMGILPARVVALPNGLTLVHFLLLQAPDEDEETFAASIRGLEKEIVQLKRLLETAAA